MSPLLKSGSAAAAARVRPLGIQAHPRAPAPPRPDPELERLRVALAETQASLAERDAIIAGIPARVDDAFAEGEKAGRASAEDKEAERSAVIEKAAGQALVRLTETLAGLERIAPLLARTCLDRMLLAEESRAATVEALLKAQLARLEVGAALSIQVSAEDFPDPVRLTALAPPPCRILCSPTIKPGDCTIQLRLGAVEVGIGQQWGVLREALEEMAR